MKTQRMRRIFKNGYTYQQNNREENLVCEDVEVTVGQVETYYIQDPSYGYFVKLNETEGLADISDLLHYTATAL